MRPEGIRVGQAALPDSLYPVRRAVKTTTAAQRRTARLIQIEGDLGTSRLSLPGLSAPYRARSGVQSRFDRERVRITVTSRKYTRVSDEDDDERTSHFCAECGATV